MRLQPKIMLLTGVIFVGHFFVVEWQGRAQIKAHVLEGIQQDARIVRGMLMSMHKVYQENFLDHNIPINAKTLGFLPAHSISRISAEFRDWVDSGLTFNNVSDRPRNPENMADEIELAAIRHFRTNPREQERLVAFDGADGELFYHFSQPLRIEERCLKCHGETEEAPASIRERYDQAFDYQLGELRGIVSVKLPAAVIEERESAQFRSNLMSHGIALSITFLLLSWLLRHTLLRRIDQFRGGAERVSEGDYGESLDESGEDELSRAASVFNLMARRVNRRERDLRRQRSIYAALSATNKAIVELSALDGLFQRVCDIAVEPGPMDFAWFGVLNPGEGRIDLVAAAGQERACDVGGHEPFIELGRSGTPLIRACDDATPVYLDEVADLRGLFPCSGGQNGDLDWVGSAALMPITLAEGEIYGVFALFGREPGLFSEDIRQLLEEMAADIAFTIANFRVAGRHQIAQAAVAESARELGKLSHRLQLLLESTGEGIFGVDDQGRCTFINQAACDMFGFPRDALIDQNIHALTHSRYADGAPYPASECRIMQALHSGRPSRVGNQVFWNRDGESFPVEYSAYPILEGGAASGVVVVFRDVTETRATERKLEFLATHDSLTNLLNRYSFEHRLKRLLEGARGTGAHHALCYLDLDQFKVINDTLGHSAGDAMLAMLAKELQRHILSGDVLARLGGDEFGLLLANCPLDQANRRAGEIRDAVRAFRFTWGDSDYSVGISIGIVAITADADSAQELLSKADSACYAAKEEGRNRIHLYDVQGREMERQHSEMWWVAEIQAALREDRFSLYRQAIVPLRDGEEGWHGEILVRMRTRSGEVIPPGRFISAAEQYNLMADVDRWVVSRLCDWFHRHPSAVADTSLCSINLSGASLGDEPFHDFLLDQVTRCDLPAERFCFEITETAAVSRLDKAARFLEELKRVGCRVALDDFGTGMSSFAYLKSLPVDILKIDGSFVKGINEDPIDRGMVESINEIGHLMGLETIAEYAESEAILETLREIGIDYAQGYAIGRPEPLA